MIFSLWCSCHRGKCNLESTWHQIWCSNMISIGHTTHVCLLLLASFSPIFCHSFSKMLLDVCKNIRENPRVRFTLGVTRQWGFVIIMWLATYQLRKLYKIMAREGIGKSPVTDFLFSYAAAEDRIIFHQQGQWWGRSDEADWLAPLSRLSWIASLRCVRCNREVGISVCVCVFAYVCVQVFVHSKLSSKRKLWTLCVCVVFP